MQRRQSLSTTRRNSLSNLLNMFSVLNTENVRAFCVLHILKDRIKNLKEDEKKKSEEEISVLSLKLGGAKNIESIRTAITRQITQLQKLYNQKKELLLKNRDKRTKIDEDIEKINSILGGTARVTTLCKILKLSFPEDSFVTIEHYQQLLELLKKKKQHRNNTTDTKTEQEMTSIIQKLGGDKNIEIIKRMFRLHVKNLHENLTHIKTLLQKPEDNFSENEVRTFYKSQISSTVEKIAVLHNISKMFELSALLDIKIEEELAELIITPKRFTELYQYYLQRDKVSPKPMTRQLRLIEHIFNEEAAALLKLSTEQRTLTHGKDNPHLKRTEEAIATKMLNMGGEELVQKLIAIRKGNVSSPQNIIASSGKCHNASVSQATSTPGDESGTQLNSYYKDIQYLNNVQCEPERISPRDIPSMYTFVSQKPINRLVTFLKNLQFVHETHSALKMMNKKVFSKSILNIAKDIKWRDTVISQLIIAVIPSNDNKKLVELITSIFKTQGMMDMLSTKVVTGIPSQLASLLDQQTNTTEILKKVISHIRLPLRTTSLPVCLKKTVSGYVAQVKSPFKTKPHKIWKVLASIQKLHEPDALYRVGFVVKQINEDCKTGRIKPR